MKKLRKGFRWFMAVALLFVLPALPALADPPVAEKVITAPGNIPPIPRAMPDLVDYSKFDPPKNPLFDLKNITFSGDMRVRPEMRSQASFGVNTGTGAGRLNTANNEYVQQWMRLGINYAISPDVDVFFQPQWAKNWGAANNTGANGAGCQSSVCANDPFNVGQGDSLFARQAFMMIRNLGVQGLSLKAGRQMIVMGNHRLFGHFDWANTGFSHDGITMQYSQPMWEWWGGWLRPLDTNFNIAPAANSISSSSFGVVPQGVVPQNNLAPQSADLFFTRWVFKPITGLSLEPLWVYFRNSVYGPNAAPFAAGNLTQTAHALGQNRHNVGGRAAYRAGWFDGTAEGYYQFGAMSAPQTPGAENLRINAYALAFEGGVTLPVPWSPRIGAEFNYASGDGNANKCNQTGATVASCGGHANTFENFYPTNHILMGYADLMAWRNMVAYSGSLQVKPFDYQPNHLEFRFWVMRKANQGDCWYRAAQNCMFQQGIAAGGGAAAAVPSATSDSLYKELDVIYTLFFKNNKVSWQLGGSYLWAGQFLDQVAQAGTTAGANGQAGQFASSAVNQIWAYTQLHVNF